MKHVKLFEAFVNEAKSVIDLKAAMKALDKSKWVDRVKIHQGNKLTGIKAIEVSTPWLGSLIVKDNGEVSTDDVSQSWGWNSSSIKDLVKEIESLSDEEQEKMIKKAEKEGSTLPNIIK